MNFSQRDLLVAALLLGIVAAGCNGETTKTTGGTKNLTGSINADGSSTVFPITQAVAEEFKKEAPKVEVAVGTTGTGGGFKRFCAGEIDISNASRPIKKEEIDLCSPNGIEYVELRVAIDGLSVVTNRTNGFAKCLTTDELKKIFEPGSAVKNWSQIRTGFANKQLRLYSPGTDSGTFDYFTAEIVGEEGASRNDGAVISFSEDDNALVTGIIGDDGNSNRPLGLGYFGFAYFEENRDKLKALAVDSGEGCIAPTRDTINSGEYSPLSRPLFIYIAERASSRPEIKAFVEFYLETASEIVADVGYIELPDDVIAEETEEWEAFAA